MELSRFAVDVLLTGRPSTLAVLIVGLNDLVACFPWGESQKVEPQWGRCPIATNYSSAPDLTPTPIKRRVLIHYDAAIHFYCWGARSTFLQSGIGILFVALQIGSGILNTITAGDSRKVVGFREVIADGPRDLNKTPASCSANNVSAALRAAISPFLPPLFRYSLVTLP